MDKYRIEDEETLYRVALSTMPGPFNDDGSVSPAIFMDAKGASVERDGEREEQAVMEVLKKRFRRDKKLIGAVKITAGKCREIGTFPNPIGNGNNEFHAEIHDSEKVVLVSLLKAMMMAKNCRIVE